MTQDIIKLLTLVLGISVAGERLVTIIKSFVPWLPAPAGTGATGPVTNSDIAKKIGLIVISFGCCLLTTALFHKDAPSLSAFDMGTLGKISSWIVALGATGGSAFWTNLLGYFSALKDATNLKALQSKNQIAGEKAAAEHALAMTHEKSVGAKLLKTVTFTSAFSGGDGTLKIDILPDGPSFEFDKDGSKDVQLAEGEIDFTISGAASPGPKGGVALTITGARASNSPFQYGPGLIQVEEQAMLV